MCGSAAVRSRVSSLFRSFARSWRYCMAVRTAAAIGTVRMGTMMAARHLGNGTVTRLCRATVP